MRGWKLLLLGTGPLKGALAAKVRERNLESFVITAETVEYEQMAAVYAASDLFVLPSLQDLNPLSVVEALHSGLPVLLSDRVGNRPEALVEGQNGWLLPVEDPRRASQAIQEAFSADSRRLERMGRVSKELAVTTWSSIDAVRRFLDVVLG